MNKHYFNALEEVRLWDLLKLVKCLNFQLAQ
jgi:hypothetical protein